MNALTIALLAAGLNGSALPAPAATQADQAHARLDRMVTVAAPALAARQSEAALSQGLVIAPATAPATLARARPQSHAERAQLTLDRLVAAHEAKLRETAVNQALAGGTASLGRAVATEMARAQTANAVVAAALPVARVVR